MLSCWCYNPEKRPKFSDLAEFISKILGKTELEYYIDLNTPYLQANEIRFNSGETDYLAMLRSPNCQAPSLTVDHLSEKYSPVSLDKRFTTTNDLYFATNTSEKSFALNTFKTNDLN